MSNETTPKFFIQVPSYLNGLGLNPTDKQVYGTVYTMLNVTGKCFMSNARIGLNVEVSATTVNRSLGKLEKLNLIKRKTIYKENMEVDKRFITLGDFDPYSNMSTPLPKNEQTLYSNSSRPLLKNGQDNISLNKSMNKSDKSTMSDKSDRSATYSEIIDYLNAKTGKKFTANAKATKKLINGRLDERFTVDDFKRVIDIKTAQWINSPKMKKFLRPATLFSSNFDSYLNEDLPKNMQRRATNELSW